MLTRLINVTVLSALFFIRTSLAADCPLGQFCVWTDEGYKGQRANFIGDDAWWESYIESEGSSWANHAIPGPGIKDHVEIYSREHYGGSVVLCLAPGQEVGSNSLANDTGASHQWVMKC